MKDAFKTNVRALRHQIKTRSCRRDDEGRIIIPLNVSDDTDFLSVFSENGNPVISSDVSDYITEKTDFLPAREKLTLRITGSCITDEERPIYTDAIREHFLTRYIMCRQEFIRNTILSLILAAAGILLLVLTGFIDEQFGIPVITEAADIAAWVFFWEALDVSVFRNHETHRECRRCMSCLDMKIEFFQDPADAD